MMDYYAVIDIAEKAKYSVVAECPQRTVCEDIAKRTGCEVFKEQGEEFYRVLCSSVKVMTTLEHGRIER
jgi:hypothetical protein